MVILLAPAGDFASLRAAIGAGADAVYFGVEHLNMRARGARNFAVDDLAEVMSLCHAAGVKGYLALNTVLHDHDMKLLDSILSACVAASVDAVIVADQAAIQKARSHGLSVHISTQLSVSNFSSVLFYSQFADCIVLARELTLDQVAAIKRQVLEQNVRGPSGEVLQIECFAHGAMCIAVSGRCFMSLFEKNASANRGACHQTCRKGFRVTNEETGDEMRVENKYVMSPEDLCTIPFLDQLVVAGIDVFKLEGRGRSPEYVKTVTSCYRRGLDAISSGTYDASLVAELMSLLQMVYNRGLSEGFYLGRSEGQWSRAYGSKATHRKAYVGPVLKYYKKPGVALIKLEARSLSVGDKVCVIGNTTGVVEGEVSELRCDNGAVVQGCEVTLPFDFVRPGDRCYAFVPVSEVGAQG